MDQELPKEGAPEGSAAPEVDPVEVQAREHGWKPAEEFSEDEKNSGKSFRTAAEFMALKPLYDKLDERGKQIKNLEKGINSLAEHNAQIEKIAYEKALATLKEQREVALEDDDFKKAERLRDEMDEVKEKIRSVKAPVIVAPVNEAFEAWKADNTWYESNRAMRALADQLGNDLMRKGHDPADIMKQVTKEVKAEFPDKFRNPNKDNAPEMDVGGKSKETKGFRLSEEEERIMNTVLRVSPKLSKQKYLADLKKIKGL